MTNEELALKVKEGEPWATLELWEALQGFNDFEELRAEDRRRVELKAITKMRQK